MCMQELSQLQIKEFLRIQFLLEEDTCGIIVELSDNKRNRRTLTVDFTKGFCLYLNRRSALSQIWQKSGAKERDLQDLNLRGHCPST